MLVEKRIEFYLPVSKLSTDEHEVGSEETLPAIKYNLLFFFYYERLTE